MSVETKYMLIMKNASIEQTREKIIEILDKASHHFYHDCDQIFSFSTLADPNMDKKIYKLKVNFGNEGEEADLRQIKKTFENFLGEECRQGDMFVTVFEYEGEFKLVNIM